LDARAAAEYYVLYRLAEQGFLASPGPRVGADLVACSPGGSRVALLRVHVRDARGSYGLSRADAVGPARNRAYVFVEFSGTAGVGPSCFVVPAAVVAAALKETPGWPTGPASTELVAYREGWQVLALRRPAGTRSAPASSPRSPSSP
jgi:hypothetical protein